MCYKPRHTPIMKMAEACGWRTVGGVQAMVAQGIAQQRLWLPGVDLTAASAKARAHVEAMADIKPTEVPAVAAAQPPATLADAR